MSAFGGAHSSPSTDRPFGSQGRSSSAVAGQVSVSRRRSVLLAMELGFRLTDLAMVALAAWAAGVLDHTDGPFAAVGAGLPLCTAFVTVNLVFDIRGEYVDRLTQLNKFKIAHLWGSWFKAFAFWIVLQILVGQALQLMLPAHLLATPFIQASFGWLDPHKLTLMFLAGSLSVAAGRAALIRIFTSPALAPALHHRICVIGSAQEAQHIADQIVAENNPRLRVIGLIETEASGATSADELSPSRNEPANWPALDSLEALISMIRQGLVDQVLVATPFHDSKQTETIMRRLSRLPVSVGLISDQPPFPHRSVNLLSGLPILRVCEQELSDWSRVLKKFEDLGLATLLILVLSPLMLLIAAAVKLDSPGPVLFTQRRCGIGNKTIAVHKFRTMYAHLTDADGAEQTIQNDSRVTRVGAFLRHYSLDELPQLFNVLVGEMSIVGPRPHAFSTKADGQLFEDAVATYMARHRVKPGMTGWAQVNGWRGETDTTEKLGKRVEHDLWYIGNWSLALDLFILVRTVGVVLKGDNAY